MLAVRTTDNWAFAVAVTVPSWSAVPETYTNAEVTATASAAAFLTWLLAAGRAWYGETFTASWARDTATGGARLTMVCGDTWELDGGALTCLGLDADTYIQTAAAIQTAAGTWDPAVPLAVSGYVKTIGEGDAEGAGTVRPGVPGLGHYAPICQGIGTALDAARLSAVLAVAASPRICDVDQEHTGNRLRMSLGDVSRQRADSLYRFTLTLAGVPV